MLFTKMFFAIVAVLLSLAGEVYAQATPDTKELGASQPKTASSVNETPVAADLIQSPSNTSNPEGSAKELVIMKKAAALAYLEKDVIKMTAYIRDNGGIAITLDVEAYPRRNGVIVFGSGSYCDLGVIEASFSVTPKGDLLISRNSRIPGCGYVHILINPATKAIRVYFSDNWTFNSGARNINNKWKLNN